MFIHTSRQYESYIIYTTDSESMVGILFVPRDATIPETNTLEPSATE
jgi:hypothetical protein